MIADHFHPIIHANALFPRATTLDVTLRDGSFPVNFQWKRHSIERIVRSLAQAQIPFVELGYYGGVPELHHVKDVGLTANVPLHLVHDLATANPATHFALMVHPGVVKTMPDFPAMKQAGVALIRFVYHHSWSSALRHFLIAAQDVGLNTSINLALSSRYQDQSALLETCLELASWSPSIIYLADTCSAFYPSQVDKIFKQLVTITTIPLGFHAHDFLSLAFANSLAAASAGASYIDISLSGIGRGAGNLRGEAWCLAAVTQKAASYNIEALLPAIDALQEYAITNKAQQDIMSIACGACNLTPPEEQLLRDFAQHEGHSVASVACRYAMLRDHLPHLTQDALKHVLSLERYARV